MKIRPEAKLIASVLSMLACATLIDTARCDFPRRSAVEQELLQEIDQAKPMDKTPERVVTKLDTERFSIKTPRRYWLSNRWADFRDCFSFGGGLTFENKITGPVPPSFGAYLELSEFLHVGHLTHNGITAECDGRGAGVYSELRHLRAFPWTSPGSELWSIRQGDYEPWVNFYKDEKRSAKWAARMAGDLSYQPPNAPAKNLVYRDAYRQEYHKGAYYRRGWHRFMHTGAELAFCDPLFTHWGLTLRFGFDVSEVFDFMLGWFTLDFQEDDLRDDEHFVPIELPPLPEVAQDVKEEEPAPAPAAPAVEEPAAPGGILLKVVDTKDPVEVGGSETYAITATNQGSVVDTNVTIVCTLEDSQEYASSSGATEATVEGNVITFAPFAALEPKTTAEWHVVVKALKVGDVRFKATMTSDQLTRPVEETEATNHYE